MLVDITRRFEIDAGHRLIRHKGKCRSYHGHRYQILITLAIDESQLGAEGHVVDFGEVKESFGAYLEGFDHAMILENNDPLINLCNEESMKVCIVDAAPTCENLARWWYKAAKEMYAAAPFVVQHIVVFETPNCSARYPRG